MIPKGREETQYLIQNRDEIMRKYAAYLWPNEPWKTQRKRMKCIINGYDMDSGVDAWAKVFGNPHKKTLKGKRVTLDDGRSYRIEEYRTAQQAGTAWLATRAKRMIELITTTMTKKEKENGKDPILRAKSYLLQEAEAVQNLLGGRTRRHRYARSLSSRPVAPLTCQKEYGRTSAGAVPARAAAT
jgi:hypothetical protein